MFGWLTVELRRGPIGISLSKDPCSALSGGRGGGEQANEGREEGVEVAFFNILSFFPVFFSGGGEFNDRLGLNGRKSSLKAKTRRALCKLGKATRPVMQREKGENARCRGNEKKENQIN